MAFRNINTHKLFIIFRKLFFYLVIVSVFFAGGYFLGKRGYQPEDVYPIVNIQRGSERERSLDFDLFWRVWDTLESRYYDKSKLIPSEMVYGAIQGMVAALGDPYTVFLPPSQNKVVQEDLKGNFDGVGIQIGFIGKQLAVIAPLPESPAEKAGIKAGDFIVGLIDEEKEIDRSTLGITLPEAVQIIRGSAGSKIKLVLLREGIDEAFEVEVTRDTIDVPSIVIDYPEENKSIVHLKLLKFVAETDQEWEEAVIEILKNPQLQAIIIDVRNNPGGYLQGAVNYSSDFLEIGDVVVREEIGSKDVQEFKSERLARLRNYKTVVLINKGSASASEILAGALRDNEGITIIGETSFGKGTIQEPQQINGGAGLHITIARWLTPSGYWVNEQGIIPDIEVEDNPETLEDEQLLRAIEELK